VAPPRSPASDRRRAGLGAALALVVALGFRPAVAGPLAADHARLENGAAGAVLGVEFGGLLEAPSAGVRAFLLADPPRAVVDLPEAAWRFAMPVVPSSPGLARAARFGLAAPGRSRVVVDLAGPAAIAEAGFVRRAAGGVALELVLAPDAPEAFAAATGWPDGAAAAAAPPAPTRRAGFVVVIDPGHGGVDPGAVRGGLREKDVTLAFARELAPRLEDAGFEVATTRSSDVFVALGERVEAARRAGADVFVSIHADALRAGEAQGAAVYVLGPDASDPESAALAARENRVDRLAGADPGHDGADVARALIDLVRADTRAASRRVADRLAAALARRTPKLGGGGVRTAGFRVLKSPDIPSVLVELGFLSSAADRARLADPAWRAVAAEAVTAALVEWAAETVSAAAP
jgi:N-acetylmuramoyl-L-alanine amidase